MDQSEDVKFFTKVIYTCIYLYVLKIEYFLSDHLVFNVSDIVHHSDFHFLCPYNFEKQRWKSGRHGDVGWWWWWKCFPEFVQIQFDIAKKSF